MDQAIGPSRRAKLTPDQQALLGKKNPGGNSEQNLVSKDTPARGSEYRAAVAHAGGAMAAPAFAA